MNLHFEDTNSNICKVINICKIIHLYVKTNFINQALLAKEIGTSPQNLSNRLKGNTLDSTMIYNISVALKHDFFKYFTLDIEKALYTKGDVSTSEKVSLLHENIELYRKLEEQRVNNERLTKSNNNVSSKRKLIKGNK